MRPPKVLETGELGYATTRRECGAANARVTVYELTKDNKLAYIVAYRGKGARDNGLWPGQLHIGARWLIWAGSYKGFPKPLRCCRTSSEIVAFIKRYDAQ